MAVKTSFGFLSSFILCFLLIVIGVICGILSEALVAYLRLSQMLSGLIGYIVTLCVVIWFGINMVGEKLQKKFISEGDFGISILIMISVATISLSGVEVLIFNFLPQKAVLESFKAYSNNFLLDFWGFLLICIIGPILEEFLFRGIILKNLLKKYSAIGAIIGSAFCFAIVHLNLVQFFSALLLGLLTGFVYTLTNSLYYSIYIHTLNNIIGFVLLYSGYSLKFIFLNDIAPPYQWLYYISVLFFCSCFFLIYKKYKST